MESTTVPLQTSQGPARRSLSVTAWVHGLVVVVEIGFGRIDDMMFDVCDATWS
jgi:hypothetical protein